MRSPSIACMCPVCGGVMLPAATSHELGSQRVDHAKRAMFRCMSCGGNLGDGSPSSSGDAMLRETMARAGQC